LRSVALKKAEKWMLERFEKSDGLARFPVDHELGDRDAAAWDIPWTIPR